MIQISFPTIKLSHKKTKDESHECYDKYYYERQKLLDLHFITKEILVDDPPEKMDLWAKNIFSLILKNKHEILSKDGTIIKSCLIKRLDKYIENFKTSHLEFCGDSTYNLLFVCRETLLDPKWKLPKSVLMKCGFKKCDLLIEFEKILYGHLPKDIEEWAVNMLYLILINRHEIASDIFRKIRVDLIRKIRWYKANILDFETLEIDLVFDCLCSCEQILLDQRWKLPRNKFHRNYRNDGYF